MGETPMPRYEPMKGRDAQSTRPSPDVAWVSRPWDWCCACYSTLTNALEALDLTLIDLSAHVIV